MAHDDGRWPMTGGRSPTVVGRRPSGLIDPRVTGPTRTPARKEAEPLAPAPRPTAMTHHRWEDVQEASGFVRSRWGGAPKVGLILGTGLGALAKEIAAEAVLPYPEVPFFPQSTVFGHRGQLVCGRLAGQTVMAMD